MRMVTNRVTSWWDGPSKFDIPSGEPVDMVSLDKVPWADRWDLKDGIAGYQHQGLQFVPVKIRNWYAIINRDWLTYAEITTPPAGQRFGDKIRERVKSLYK